MSSLSSPKIRPSIHVGLDVHKRTIVMCAVDGQKTLFEKTFATPDLAGVRKALGKLAKTGPVVACYEAGQAGFALHRQITDWGYSCQVIAPSLIPTKPGERKKCDRLDAQRLAKYSLGGMLTEVRVPTVEEEAARDLVRHRFTMNRDLVKAKHRVVKFLRRKGQDYTTGENWTQMHRTWLSNVVLPNPYDQEAFESLRFSVDSLEKRVLQLDKRIREIAESPAYQKMVSYVRGFRGIDTLSAMVLVTEIGDMRRFKSPRALMAYLGLVPGVHSTGESKRKGQSITKAGNAFCRHVLVQAAWSNTKRPVMSKALKVRQNGLPDWVVEHSWKAQQRLHKRFRHLEDKRSRVIAVVAIARELAAFVGSVMLRSQLEGEGISLDLNPPAESDRASKGKRSSRGAKSKDAVA